MSGKPAARVSDKVTHALPPSLVPGPGSPNVLIGYLPAWRGVPAGAAAALQSAKKASETVIQAAEKANKVAGEAAKVAAAAQMSSMITSMAGGADIHLCITLLPPIPHGPGVVIDGSKTVLINGLPACRKGDTVLEAIGPPNKISKGEQTVLIGD